MRPGTASGQKVLHLGVPLDIVADETAQRRHFQTMPAHVLQSAGDQAARNALPFQCFGHFGVREAQHAAFLPIGGDRQVVVPAKP